MTNSNRLFYGSCFALITTAFSFSISAGTLKQLGIDLGYSAENLGYISSLWFFGFPISMIMGGLVYNSIGPKRIMQTAFFTHILGLALTLIAIFFISEWSFITLLISNLLLGIGCGCTEAACNPMIANAYEGNIRNKMLNRFHMWFPGGIVVGALLSEGMASIGLPWESQFWIILIPAIIYFIDCTTDHILILGVNVYGVHVLIIKFSSSVASAITACFFNKSLTYIFFCVYTCPRLINLFKKFFTLFIINCRYHIF